MGTLCHGAVTVQAGLPQGACTVKRWRDAWCGGIGKGVLHWRMLHRPWKGGNYEKRVAWHRTWQRTHTNNAPGLIRYKPEILRLYLKSAKSIKAKATSSRSETSPKNQTGHNRKTALWANLWYSLRKGIVRRIKRRGGKDSTTPKSKTPSWPNMHSKSKILGDSKPKWIFFWRRITPLNFTGSLSYHNITQHGRTNQCT